VCLDQAGDVAITRTIYDRFPLDKGHLVLSPGPGSGGAEDLIREILIRLSMLWRLPTRLQCGGNAIAEDERATVEWEISWALTRAGITDLWVLNANLANAFAWLWLRDTAEREHLRLTLHTTAAPDTLQAAALTGCQVRMLDPNQLLPKGRTTPWWSRPRRTD